MASLQNRFSENTFNLPERNYKCLNQHSFKNGRYELVPISDEDKYLIMQWRNEQIDILRQKQALTKEQQENYFSTVVSKLFDVEFPSQLLFSFLEDGKFVGYGGLVHIDWESRLAEISFLTETSRNKNPEQFLNDWINYLTILKSIAKDHLKFQKIFTYAYDIRPLLYDALQACGFIEEARLKDHISIHDTKKDVLIHSCFLEKLVFRMANAKDVILYYEWANDETVRLNSYNQKQITLEEHSSWFNKKIESGNCFFYLFISNGSSAGQVRIDKSGNEVVIGISVDSKYRGKGLSAEMLKQASDHFINHHPGSKIAAYIKETNLPSYKSFKQAGFSDDVKTEMFGEKSYKLIKQKHEF